MKSKEQALAKLKQLQGKVEASLGEVLIRVKKAESKVNEIKGKVEGLDKAAAQAQVLKVYSAALSELERSKERVEKQIHQVKGLIKSVAEKERAKRRGGSGS